MYIRRWLWTSKKGCGQPCMGTVLPDVQIRGCVFHGAKAIRRKVNNKNMSCDRVTHCPTLLTYFIAAPNVQPCLFNTWPTSNIRLCLLLPTIWPTLYRLTQICGSNDGSNLLFTGPKAGLQVAYTEGQGTYGWIRKLLALPFLPYTEITTQFERLRLGAEGPRKELAEYIASQWIYNAIFTVKDWFVFLQPVRTNNVA